MPLSVPSSAELRSLRTGLGLTQAELARKAGVSQPLIARIEKGTVDPRLSTLRAVVDALNSTERGRVRLREIMTAPVATVRATDTVSDAAQLMRERGYSQLPVVHKGVPVGSLSERSVVHALASAQDAQTIARAPLRTIMGPPFPTVEPEESVDHAYHLLEEFPAVVVMERGRIVGLVAKSNLLHLF
ncbi:MAG: CBS domain-containing protein [Thermoplasmatota archaeon]